MFEFIKGTLEEILADSIVVENGGIAYKIFSSKQVLNSLPKIGDSLKVYLHMNVREDDITLYGFLSKEERNMYRRLTGVSGVGPKAAIGLLSVYTASEIIWAIMGEDVKALSKAPGIGKKIAQRIILELKDKLEVEGYPVSENQQELSKKSGIKEEAIDALIALGYQPSQSYKVISDIYKESMNVESLIKEALKVFASKS